MVHFGAFRPRRFRLALQRQQRLCRFAAGALEEFAAVEAKLLQPRDGVGPRGGDILTVVVGTGYEIGRRSHGDRPVLELRLDDTRRAHRLQQIGKFLGELTRDSMGQVEIADGDAAGYPGGSGECQRIDEGFDRLEAARLRLDLPDLAGEQVLQAVQVFLRLEPFVFRDWSNRSVRVAKRSGLPSSHRPGECESRYLAGKLASASTSIVALPHRSRSVIL